MRYWSSTVVVPLLLAGCSQDQAPASSGPDRTAKVALGTVPASEVAVWEKLTPSQSPSVRYGHSLAYSPTARKTYLFGGHDTKTNQVLADLWAWDGTAWTLQAATASPLPRQVAALAYDPKRKSLVLYGGIDYSKGTPEKPIPMPFGDTWEWTDAGKWIELKPASPRPSALYSAGVATDTTRGKILLVGGYTSEPDGPTGIGTNDLWEWDGTSTTWTKRTPPVSNEAPPFVCSEWVAYDEHRQRLVFHIDVSTTGGFGDSLTAAMYWDWDPVSEGWTRHRPSDDFGRPSVLGMAYDASRRRVVLRVLDYTTAPKPLTREIDTDTATWYERADASTPSGTGAMVFDSNRNVMVTVDETGDTWEYKVSELGHGEGCTPANATACASGFCVDGVCCDVAACSGKCTSCNGPGTVGTCAAAPAGTEVAGSCGSGLACDASGGCKAKNGQTCSAATECASGFCADGVCCDHACTGPCVICNLLGQTGRCRPQSSGTDPRGQCGTGAAVCRSSCDGTGRCGFPDVNAACGDCMTCDGFGACGSYDYTCPPPAARDGTCYVDSVNGDDTRSGLSEATAVKSQAQIVSTCGTVRYKRGSVFNEKLRIVDGVTTYGNYGSADDPLPRFVVPRTKASGPVIQATGKANLTFDGLSLSGATGDGTMAGLKGVLPTGGGTPGLVAGTCVVLGYDNQLRGCEISHCDIGVLAADGSPVIEGNFIHDLQSGLDPPASLDPYLVGAGVGVLINGAGPTVRRNVFIGCSGPVTAAGPSPCYGGAVENIVPSGVSIYPTIESNFFYGNCGLTQIGRYSGDIDKGNAQLGGRYYRNIAIDTGWMAVLKVDGLTLAVSFVNNTFVAHKGTTNAGTIVVIDPSVAGADLPPDNVTIANDLFLFEDVPDMSSLVHKNLVQHENLFIDMTKRDPGVVNGKGTTAADFDLVAGSPAINGGSFAAVGTDAWWDFFGRFALDGSPEIGACDYCARFQSQTPPGAPFFAGAMAWIGAPADGCGSGGRSGTGGATARGGSGGWSAASGGTSGSPGRGGVGGATLGTPGGSGGTGLASGGAGGGPRSGNGGQPGAGGSMPQSGSGSRADAGTGSGRDAALDAVRPPNLHAGCSCALGFRSDSSATTALLVCFGVWWLGRGRRSP